MTYRRRATPLHAARASVACAYCLALAGASLLLSNPVALGGLTIAIGACMAGAGLLPELRRALLFCLPLALTIALVNALASREGLTVLVRFGVLPVLGHTDITLEATAYGAVLGLRATAMILCGALYTGAVDPDQVMRGLRRFGFRSALSATIATRMVPILARDARRLGDAARCRPGPPPSRLALMRAATNGLLDRALDVAAALEVRGYSRARRPPRLSRPVSRHDVEFGLAAAAILLCAIALRSQAPFTAYPSPRLAFTTAGTLLAGALPVLCLAPFADRRGIEP